MIIHTASEGVTLAKKLEDDSARYYEELAKRFADNAEVFLAYAKENAKNQSQIQRAYYGVITDALEGGYAFNLETDNYVVKADIDGKAGIAEMLGQAIANEEAIIKYYNEAAEQSRALMADVPRTFTLIARKRGSRLDELKELVAKQG